VTYNDTLQFLNGLQQFGWRLGLDNITALLDGMGNPHLRLKSVHIAGTNGKGSTAAILESIYRAAGYKTGLYTSPHLVEVAERIKISGEQISTARLSDYLKSHRHLIEKSGCTYFEVLTAVAFQYFADEAVDLALIEVGLGGRFDATNVIVPELSIITEIDLDHTDHLGRTLRQIAGEKAGIIKPLTSCLSGSNKKIVNSLLRAKCVENDSPLYLLNEMVQIVATRLDEYDSEFDVILPEKTLEGLNVSLAGEHQIKNAALAVAAAELLKRQMTVISETDIRQGLRNVHWPARLQTLSESPKIIVDVAHNPAGFRKLLSSIKRIYKYKRLLMVIGLLRDKDFRTIAELVGRAADVIVVTTPGSDRALPAPQLADEIMRYSRSFEVRPEIAHAFEHAIAIARDDDLICITGSHYVVGEFLKFHKKA
jgi:dihydrofolate synthase/folylpolyglutamate synthase